MSSLPLHTRNSAAFDIPALNNSALSGLLAGEIAEKRARVLRQIANSGRLIDVRPASRLEVRPKPEMLSSGIPEVDAMIAGFPRGCLSEICGPRSSGKSSLLLAAIAATTRQGESCVLIDASDSFDPASGAAAGVEFGKLLWVRCGKSSSIIERRSWVAQFSANDQRRTTNDVEISRPGENRLEQLLKAADLVLQSGGFGLVALDLAGIPEKYVRRIPLASWFRFQRAVEHTKTALLVVNEFACAQTCAAVVLKLENQSPAVSLRPSGKPCHAELFEGLKIEAEVVRSRLERKPAESVKANFSTRAVRAG
jgi:RecA DNA recombination protein